jgi:hypothetical protein
MKYKHSGIEDSYGPKRATCMFRYRFFNPFFLKIREYEINMRHGKIWRILLLFLLLLSFPLLLGQGDFYFKRKQFRDYEASLKHTPMGASFYVARLSFLDAESGTRLKKGDGSEQLNKAVSRGIRQVCLKNRWLKYDTPSNRVEDTDENVKKFWNIIYYSKEKAGAKISNIISSLMKPNGVDLLVSGLYFAEDEEGIIKLITVVVHQQRRTIKSSQLKLRNIDYLCPDPANPAGSLLCETARRKITNTVRRLIFEVL